MQQTDKNRQAEPGRHRREKLCWDLSPGRLGGKQGNAAESSRVVQTSVGSTTGHAFLGHLISTSLYPCTARLQRCEAGGLSPLDHLMILTQQTDLKTTPSLRRTSESLPLENLYLIFCHCQRIGE